MIFLLDILPLISLVFMKFPFCIHYPRLAVIGIQLFEQVQCYSFSLQQFLIFLSPMFTKITRNKRLKPSFQKLMFSSYIQSAILFLGLYPKTFFKGSSLHRFAILNFSQAYIIMKITRINVLPTVGHLSGKNNFGFLRIARSHFFFSYYFSVLLFLKF